MQNFHLNRKNNKKLSRHGGYSLLELVFYIALFAVFVIAVINALTIMTKSFKETSIQRTLGSGGDIMERMSREVRQALSVNSISANDLKLDTLDSAGAARTVEFVLSGSNVQLLENNALTGNLNAPGLSVIALTFTGITTANGAAIKLSMTVQADSDASGRTESFYDTVVLRGKY